MAIGLDEKGGPCLPWDVPWMTQRVIHLLPSGKPMTENPLIKLERLEAEKDSCSR